MKFKDFQKNKKIIAGGVIVILLVIGGFIVYEYADFSFENIEKSREKEISFSDNEGKVLIKQASLFKRQAGENVQTNKFSPGDYIEMEARFELQGEETRLTFPLLSKNGEIVEERFLPPLSYDELVRYHRNDERIFRCCGTAPVEEGAHYIGVFSGEEKLGEIDFEIIGE